MLVAGLKGLKVIDVACGSGDAQTLAVTENGMWSSCCPGQALSTRGSAWRGWVSDQIEPSKASMSLVCKWVCTSVSSAELQEWQSSWLLLPGDRGLVRGCRPSHLGIFVLTKHESSIGIIGSLNWFWLILHFPVFSYLWFPLMNPA